MALAQNDIVHRWTWATTATTSNNQEISWSTDPASTLAREMGAILVQVQDPLRSYHFLQ